MAKIRHHGPDILLVDIDPENPNPGIEKISLVKDALDDICIFAIGLMTDSVSILRAMRRGATEYLDREGGAVELLEAFCRFLRDRGNGPGRDPEEGSG